MRRRSTAKTSATSTCASRFHRLLLHNLEMIFVIDCEQLEEIEEKEEEGMDTSKITLPRLQILWLRSLPELKSICSSSKMKNGGNRWSGTFKTLRMSFNPSFGRVREKPIMLFLDVPSRLIKSSLIGDQVEDGMKYFRGLCEQGELHS
uniref:Uncharacterized protein n=1 Tax=Fagus sylvatica TaxID=28930 RepID=A0A2N9EW20_FAGSY